MTYEPRRLADPDEDVELGEQVDARVAKPSAKVVAVRMQRELLARVSAYAQRRGITVSDVLRQGAERLIGETVHFGPTYVTGVAIHGPHDPAVHVNDRDFRYHVSRCAGCLREYEVRRATDPLFVEPRAPWNRRARGDAFWLLIGFCALCFVAGLVFGRAA